MTSLRLLLLGVLRNEAKITCSQSWDASRGAPTGIIVLGGAIRAEVSMQRGLISFTSAAERITGRVPSLLPSTVNCRTSLRGE